LLGLDYEDSDGTPAGQPGESPAAPSAVETVQEDSAEGNKKSLSIVGYDAEDGDEQITPKGKGEGNFEEKDNDEGASTPNPAQLLPPSPVAQVDAALQARCEKLHETTKSINFNNHLRRSHAFRNPEILPKLVEQRELDQFGSCYPKEVFDPDSYQPSMFFEQIYREQNRMLAAKQAKAKEAKKPQVQKIVGSAGVPVVRQSSTGSGSTAGFGTRSDSGEPSKKRSKWDNRPTQSSTGNAYADYKNRK